MGLVSYIKRGANYAKDKAGDALNYLDGATNRDQAGDADKLRGLGDDARRFGQESQGQFRSLGGEADQEREYLRRVARGEESVSAQQLRNSLQQNQSMQQSMAAGARPANAAMAARTAAMTAGRQGAALAGQQSIAGVQERAAAHGGLANMIMQQRQQELQGAQGSRGQAINAYGTAFTGAMQQPTGAEKLMGAAATLGPLIAMSDERIKHDVRDGEEAAHKSLKGLRAHVFKYDSEKHGKGDQLGVMAQELERAGLGHAIVETSEGKAVHGGKLATGLAAMLPGINRRLEDLEGK